MNLWRLELLRMGRTHRWAILVGVYLLFGVLGPFTGRYFGELMVRFGGDLVLDVPPPQPVDGIGQFLSNASQVGLLAVVIVAAGALAIDARREVAAFLRTRVEPAGRLLWPRYAVVTATTVLALVAGTTVAWVLTTVLIGPLPAGAMVLGTVFGALYLAFAVAVLAAVGAATNGTIATVLGGLGVLLVLPLVGVLPPVEPWLPSFLVGAVVAMVEGVPASEYLRATLVTAAATAGLLLLAARRLGRREV